jgi:hypothetical protein
LSNASETLTESSEQAPTFALSAPRTDPRDELTRMAARELASEPTIPLGPRNIRRLLAGGALVTAGALGWLVIARGASTHDASSAVVPSPTRASAPSAFAATDGERQSSLPLPSATASAVASMTRSVEPPPPDVQDRAAAAPQPPRTSPVTAPRKTGTSMKRARRSDLDYDDGF